jgi:O-antigen ligase
MPAMLLNAISIVYTWNIFSTLWEINILIWVGSSVYLYALAENKDRLLKALLAGVFVSSLCAMLQFKILFPNLLEIFQGGKYEHIVKGQAIPVSSFAYHNILGGYFAFVLPVALYYSIVEKKSLYIFVSSIIIAGLVLTTSRIAMGIVILETLFCIALTIKERNLRGFFSILGMLVCTTICLSFLFFVDQKDVKTGVRNELEKKVKTVQTQITTFNTRTEIWRNGINTFLEKPFVGHGSGSFEYAYRKSFDGGIYTKYSHSIVLKILVELGLLGMLCAIWYLAGVLYGIRKSQKNHRDIFVCVALGAAFLFAVLDFAFDIPAFVITFFVFSFVILPGSVKKTARTGLKHAFSFIVIALLIGALFFSVKTNLSKKSIENGEAYLESGFVKDAYYAYVEAIQEMPFENEGRIRAVDVLNNVYLHEKDKEKKETFKRMLLGHLMKAEKYRDKDSGLFFVIGTGYFLTGDQKKAEEYLLRAHSYYPSSAHYIYEIVSFYIKKDEPEKAKKWTHAVDPYLEKYMTSRNPNGFFVYRIRDLEAYIEYRRGNIKDALLISKKNLEDAEKEKFLISSVKSREFIQKDHFLQYLKKKIVFYERELF